MSHWQKIEIAINQENEIKTISFFKLKKKWNFIWKPDVFRTARLLDEMFEVLPPTRTHIRSNNDSRTSGSTVYRTNDPSAKLLTFNA